MTLFDASENVKILAMQSIHYDRYAGCQYFLERVDVQGKCGLVCCEEIDNCGTHSKVLLAPAYNHIEVHKISGSRALYDKYAVFAGGTRIGQFTLVLNAWVPN